MEKEICFIVAGTVANQAPRSERTDTNLYVPVVTLSILDNVKLRKQLESGFRLIGINMNVKLQIKRKTDNQIF